MKSYVIFEKRLFISLQRGQLKNFNTREGFYLQDTEGTIREVVFNDRDNKVYYILSWKGAIPSSLLPRYKPSGKNDRVNRIFTEREMHDYLQVNVDEPED